MSHHRHLSKETQMVHPPKESLPKGNEPLVSPIYQSVKFKPSSMGQVRDILSKRGKGYLYSRISNPTVRELEVLLANLQGRDDALATSSGVAALTAVAMTFLSAGDRVVVFTESYKPTRFLLGGILSRFGVQVTRISRDDYSKFEELCRSDHPPKLVFLESPTNPALRLHDLERIVSSAKKSGSLTVLDNTFAGFTHHGNIDIDLFVHSLTKQANGHSDAMGGVIIAKKDLIEKIFPVAMTLGGCLDPNSAWLTLRGMKTYALRTKESSKNALEMAQWLQGQPWAKNVRYPALKNHPDHDIWKKQMPGDGGAVVTFDLHCDEGRFDQFFDQLKLFTLTPSLGCVESLAAPCLLFFADDLPADDARKAGITSTTVRLAIGIESVSDLKQDLEQAANAART